MHEDAWECSICLQKSSKENISSWTLGTHINDMNKVIIYNTKIESHFEFCSSMLLMWIKLRVGKRTSVNDIIRTMKWMSIKQRVVLNTLLCLYTRWRWKCWQNICVIEFNINMSKTPTTNNFEIPMICGQLMWEWHQQGKCWCINVCWGV
jgi:hypothetical protein